MLLVNVDFFSSGRVAGWTNAKLNGSEKIVIKSDIGVERDISDLITIYRPDVANKFNYSPTECTGFNINLFDLFNNRVKHFSIFVDNYEAWSSQTQINKLEQETKVKRERFFEIGGRRIIVIYEQGSWLDVVVGRLNSWSFNQFNKSMNSGVSISFMSVSELRENIKKTDLSKSNNVFIIERSAVRDSVVLSQDISISPIIILENYIDLSLDYSGLLNSVFFMNNYTSGTEITPVILRDIIDTLVTYGELFFEDESGSLLYVYGNLSASTASEIRVLNTEKEPFKGCIIISEREIKKISDFDKEKNSIFINSSLLKNTYDIINADPINFLETCLKRGIKVKNLREGKAT